LDDGGTVWLLFAELSWAGECVGDDRCACERERLTGVLRTLSEHEASDAASATAPLWAEVVTATCHWAAPTDACVELHRCARLHAEDRLAELEPGPTQIRLAAAGHPGCTPASGLTCANEAAQTEDARLEAVMTDLRRRHVSPDVAQATWSRYRDAVCREDALAAGADRAWETSACRAVETARRTALLTSLAPPP